jgi:uncharacterized membrane protein YhaH (DUF805 family)
MTFSESVRSGFQNYAVFKGRTARRTFWYWVLFTVILGLVASILDSVMGGGRLLQSVVDLALIVPNLAIGVRRLHDIGKSWKWILLILIPVLGWIYLIYLYIQPGEGPNEYGAAPDSGPVMA